MKAALLLAVLALGSLSQPPAPSAATCASSTGPGIPPPARVPAGLPGFHAAWYGQSGYMRLCPGERATATVAYYNSGSRGWVAGRMGEAAYLGSWDIEPGQDQPSVLGGDGQRGSPATAWPRFDRPAVQPQETGATLMPAEVSTAPDFEPEETRPQREQDEEIDVDSVFSKLKQLKRPHDEDEE